jgi:hypothetical protein
MDHNLGVALELPSEAFRSAAPQRSDRDDLRALIVDLTTVPGFSAPVPFPREEQKRWLAGAAKTGGSLAILATPGRVELYSCARRHKATLGEAINAIAARVASTPALGRARTFELSGDAAALHLLHRAAGLEPNCVGDLRVLPSIHAAAALSASCLALGPVLASLFRAASSVGHRTRRETAISVAETSSARSLECLSAARIAHEEFSSWLAQVMRLDRGSSVRPIRRQSTGFPCAEPCSALRSKGSCLPPGALGCG